MAHGSNITGIKGGALPSEAQNANKGVENRQASPHENQRAQTPKENAPQLFDKKWHNAKADGLKNNLSSILSGGENHSSKENGRANGHENRQENNRANNHENRHGNRHENKNQPDAPKNQTLRQQAEQTIGQTLKHTTDAAKNLLNNQTDAARNSLNNQTEPARNSVNKQLAEPAKELLNKTWDTLVKTAKEHKDLSAFRNQPKQFWKEVRQMSELRLVETFVHGKAEPRVASRYGELLRQLERQGGRLQDFLATLSPSERQVFQARQQIERTFGAGELFAGKGIALDKRGDFPVRVFLSQNGKNVELPPHTILSILNGGSAEGLPTDFSGVDAMLLEHHALFTNGETMFNAKTAALLSLSLALYQNIGVALSLTDVTAETLLQNQMLGNLLPNAPSLPVDQAAARSTLQTASENLKNNEAAARRAGEGNVAGALVNGTFATIDKYRKERFESDGVTDKSDLGNPLFAFSAGATGAMMGATVGCIVPLAERSVGEILGFAASVVVGLSDNGLRSLGVNTLVSVITTGAQIFLSVAGAAPPNASGESSVKSLNAAPSADFFEDELRQTIFNRRQASLLAS